jgi:hypothetical protein
VIESFKTFIEQNKEELELIKAYYDKTYATRITFKEVKEFAKKLEAIPTLKKQETLWRAYRTLEPQKVIESTEYTL